MYAYHPGIKAHATNLPQHVAIVMDGNGRWALSKKMSRTKGHRKGVEIARDIIYYCQEKGIKVLTLFAFGVENWKRPSKEVRNLLRIFFLALRKEVAGLHKENIQLRIMGDKRHFDPTLIEAITQAEALTQFNKGLVLNVAVNYSGRWDILNAVQKVLDKKIEKIEETILSQELSLASLPEPDLFIRTGGAQRISNFILWELAYTELFFTNVLWPEFNITQFEAALSDFAKRERRFGLTAEQIN